MRGSQTCLNKTVHEMTILTEFGNLHISLKQKGYFAKNATQ